MQIDWSKIPEWLSAIGTVGTLMFSLLQLYYYRKEQKSYSLKAQADKISAWIYREDESETQCILNNFSNMPVYNVIITILVTKGAGGPRDGIEADSNYQNRELVGVLPPGKYKIGTAPLSHGMHIGFGIEIAFSDVQGNSWVRKSNGELILIKKSPIEYYNIPQPFNWETEFFPLSEIQKN